MPTPGFDRFAELEGAAVLPKTRRSLKGRRSGVRKRYVFCSYFDSSPCSLRLSPNYTTTLLPIENLSNVGEEEDLPAIENVDDIEEEEVAPMIEDFSDVEEEECKRTGGDVAKAAQRPSAPFFVELPSAASGLFAPRLPDPITLKRRRGSRAEEKMRTRRCTFHVHKRPIVEVNLPAGSLDNDVRMFRLRGTDDRQLSLTLEVLRDCDQRQAVFGVCAVTCELVGVHEVCC